MSIPVFRRLVMGRILLLGGLVCLVAGSAPAAPAKRVEGAAPEEHSEYLLVGFRKGAADPVRRSAHAAAGAERIRSFRRIPVDVVRIGARKKRAEVMATYRARKDVAFVEPNYRRHKSQVPNDPLFGDCWGLNNTGQTGGTPGADISVTNVWATRGTGGTNILVAVIDTGIDYTHEDLAANVWTNPDEIPGNGEDDDGNGIIDDLHGARWTNGDGLPTGGDPLDGDGHGTHVSGTIGAIGNNSLGVAGVNWQVRLVALKFLDDTGSGWTADAIAALEYAIDQGAQLSNNSWGGGGYSQALKDMIDAAGAANQLFIAAAGNSGSDNDIDPQYPASYACSNIIAVASSDHDDLRSSFSCFGRTSVDLAAPGSDILSTVPGDNYDTYSGTSMATPHVSGAVALLWSLHPEETWQIIQDWILQGATRLASWNGLTGTGGRLNVSESTRIADLPAGVSPVEAFVAESGEGDISIFLGWSHPAPGGEVDFVETIIRRGAEGYPGRWDEGDPVYAGPGETFEDVSVSLGARYFYAAWAVYSDGMESFYSAPAFAQGRVGGEPDDYFTEIFNANDTDLAFTTVTFIPDDSLNGYAAFADPATELPTDPSGGTPLELGDDDYAVVDLAGGQTVQLYGTEYAQFYVGANGYLTFGQGDFEYWESLASHFQLPRVSALFDDLNTSAGGAVSWKQLDDRVAVSFVNVPEYGNNNPNTFQIEMFFHGTIRLTWLALSARDGLAGLSAGAGIPFNFVESNLSDYPSIDPLRITPRTTFFSSGVEGGPFDPAGQSYGLSNAGPAALDWSLVSQPAWLDAGATSGTLAPDEGMEVAVGINASANALGFGVYASSLVFSNAATGRTHARPARLAVTREGFSALLFADGFMGSNFVLPALQNQGYGVVEAASWAEFNQTLAAPGVRLAVALNQAEFPGLDLDALETHLQDGGQVVVADWSRDPAIGGVLEAAYTGGGNESSVQILEDSLAEGVANPMPLVNPGWFTFAMGLESVGDAESPAEFPGGDSALVWGRGGRSALLGFLADALTAADGQRFFENLIGLLEQGGDDLKLQPRGGFSASGYELGPFAPAEKEYTLVNLGSNSASWTAGSTSGWAQVENVAGTLDAGSSTTITVRLAAGIEGLPPGTYGDELVVSNTASGKRFRRPLQLTVVPLPGEIVVMDSVAPTNDLDLPFGDWIVGQSRTEQITIHNVDAQYGLEIRGVYVVATQANSSASTALPPATAGRRAANPADSGKTDSFTGRHVPDSLLVGFASDHDISKRDNVHAAVGARRVHRYRRIATDVVALPKDSDLKAVIAAYRQQPGVAYAEPNSIRQAWATPDDPRFGELWGLHNTGQTGGTPGADIRAPAAWDITIGSAQAVVAVIDTGIDYTHPDLAGNIWVNAGETENGLDDDGNGIIDDIHGARWTDGSGVPTSGDPMDDNEHGTHCAGTIGASGDNGLGVAGVNWHVRLMALKFLDGGGFGSTADAISALEYAIDKGAHLSNNSWGGGDYSQALKDMIDAAGAANQLFLAAAGNDGTDNDTLPHYPSSYLSDNIVAVASSDHNDERSSFSCFGRTSVDLAAPGSSILSTVPGGGYSTFSGTSMATPHVSGVAALMRSLHPTAPASLIKQALMDGVDILPAWTDRTISGGRLNAAAALQLLNPHFQVEGVGALPVVIPPGESKTFDVIYRPVEPGSHAAFVRILSNDTNAPVVHVALHGTAVADVLEVSPSEPFQSQGSPGGPFAPESKTYQLTNAGDVPVGWTASATSAWLSLSSGGGILPAGGITVVTASVGVVAQTLPGGLYADTILFSNSLSGVVKTRAASLRIETPLCDAVEACAWMWTSGGDAPWIVQTDISQDGIDAAQSGAITDDASSWMQAEVEGAGELSFWWKVSSEEGWDYLEFWIDDQFQDGISGEIDWHQKTFELSEGAHTLRWVYAKDSSWADGADRGWVDQIAFAEVVPEDASDHAGNYVPATFVDGSNGGYGFRPWEIYPGEGASAVLDSSTSGTGDINSTNGYAFRFYGGPGATYVDAIRPFASSLQPGDVFRVTIAYNWNGGARGVNVLAADDYELFNVNFRGGDILSFKWGNAATIDFPAYYSSTAVMHVVATQLDDRQLHVALSRNDGFATNFTSSGLPAAAAKVKFYNGGHPGNDVRYALYVNDLIILRDKSGDRDGDGLPDTWENRFFGGPTNAVPGAMAANGVNTVGQAYIADLDPTDPGARFPPIALGMPLPGNLVLRLDPTSTARIYRVEWTTNLAANPQEWNLHLPEEPGTGAELDFILTNDALQRIYRTGVRLP